MIQNDTVIHPYILGLDVGIASVGWSVVETTSLSSVIPLRLLDAGVRTFQAAEVGKQGVSPNLERRLARSTRNRLKRRKQRLRRSALLLSSFLDIDKQILFETKHGDLWKLRSDAISRKLSDQELAKVIYHILKHRGFKSSRKYSKNDEDKKLMSDISVSQQLLKGYQSFGQMIYSESQRLESPLYQRKRNTTGSYIATPLRSSIEVEIKDILSAQKQFGNHNLTEAFLVKLLELLNQQKPFATRQEILDKVGNCSLLPQYKRSSLHSVTFQEFRNWQKLNNLHLIDIQHRQERPLLLEEKHKIIDKLQNVKELTYLQARKLLCLPETILFKDLLGQPGKNLKEIEKKTLVSNDMFYQLRKTIQEVENDYWGKIESDRQLIDQIAEELTLCPTEEELEHVLEDMLLPEAVVKAILTLPNKTGFSHLSLNAIKKILPFLREGLDYVEACRRAELTTEIEKKLFATIPAEDIRNPVVLRTLTQTRKVVKAVVRKYGPPLRIHLELARDIKKTFQERKKIERLIDERTTAKQRVNALLIEEFKLNDPRALDREKYTLWSEQNHQCAYSGIPISAHMLFDDNATQIDHAIPFSRTLDDTYFNKVLSLTGENQKKRNQTPFEYLNGKSESQEWLLFESRVNSWNIPPKKRFLLLRENTPEKKLTEDLFFQEKDLNDTRYISRYLVQYLQQNVPFSGSQKRQVLSFSGPITSYFRNHWGLSKSRENDRHHAVDAVVIACINSHMLSRVIEWARLQETNRTSEKAFFPAPWTDFNPDIRYRILEDRIGDLWKHTNLDLLYADRKDKLTPLFVSRAPRHRATGKIHQETLSSLSNYLENKTLRTRKLLEKPIPISLQNGISGQMLHQIDEKKSNSITIVPRGNSNAVAKKGDMVRIDIFKEEERYYFVPVYTEHLYAHRLPMKACVSKKDEEQWKIMRESSFLFSLYPDDYVKLNYNDGTSVEGYYVKSNRSSAAIDLISHDRSAYYEGLGILRLKSIEKLMISPLGETGKVHHEKRLQMILNTSTHKP